MSERLFWWVTLAWALGALMGVGALRPKDVAAEHRSQPVRALCPCEVVR